MLEMKVGESVKLEWVFQMKFFEGVRAETVLYQVPKVEYLNR